MDQQMLLILFSKTRTQAGRQSRGSLRTQKRFCYEYVRLNIEENSNLIIFEG